MHTPRHNFLRTLPRLLTCLSLGVGVPLLFVFGLTPAAWGNETAVATFAGGCFWCVEEAFDGIPGVISTTSGYTGGHTPNPTYRQVSSETTGHAEAVQVVYDPDQVTYEQLLNIFWHNIDPLDAGGQFCDRGSSYRSAIFAETPQQLELAEISKEAIAEQFEQPIATEIESASTFYPAEDYHQDYHLKNPLQYKYYRFGCRRDPRLQAVWGERAGVGDPAIP
ncbi:MAG: peptide-methionine (S)-S-oxide reductase MsrA [Cyanobacteriota bacterium]|nr:peptide-methionine (S)-S-oxide reductase MsrA [Cyanobacteriota bacterium]